MHHKGTKTQRGPDGNVRCMLGALGVLVVQCRIPGPGPDIESQEITDCPTDAARRSQKLEAKGKVKAKAKAKAKAEVKLEAGGWKLEVRRRKRPGAARCQ